MAFTKLGSWIHRFVHTNTDLRDNCIAWQLSEKFSRVKYNADADFDCSYEISPEGLVMRLTPKSDYGEFIMRKVYDTECAEELAKT